MLRVILVLAREHLAAEIKHRQWGRQSNRLHYSEQSKIPSADNTEHAESTPNPQQQPDMLQIRRGRSVWDGKICCRDEGEEED